MAIGTESNGGNNRSSSGRNNKQDRHHRQTQPWQERRTLRNAQRKADGTIQGTMKQAGARQPTARGQPSHWNDTRQAQKRSRRNHPWYRAEDIRTRKVEDPTAKKWSGDGKASRTRVSWYSMCASEDEKDARESNAGAPRGIEREHHDDGCV